MSYRLQSTLIASILLVFTGLGSTAIADDDVEFIDRPITDTDRDDGLHGSFDVEGSFNLVSNRNRIGQNDGTSMHVGGGFNGQLDYLSGDHRLRNRLNYDGSWARTPKLEQFVKNNDSVDFESLYYYQLLDWLGPFGRFNLQTAAFATDSITATEVDYFVTYADGHEERMTTDRLRLADPFRPIELFESAGIAAEPVRETPVTLTTRTGFGARQTFASGVFVLQDDVDTEAETEVTELANTFQAGAEAFVGLEGSFDDQRVRYRAGATGLIPFINNDDTGRSALELTRLGFTGEARVDIFDWMGLRYNVLVLNDPQLLDEVQVQNSLLLTFNYTLLDTDAGDEDA